MTEKVKLQLDRVSSKGSFIFEFQTSHVTEIFKNIASNFSLPYRESSNTLTFSYADALAVFREADRLQGANFLFEIADSESQKEFDKFLSDFNNGSLLDIPTGELTQEYVEKLLTSKGFTKRKLTTFQYRDLIRLLSIPQGANFSVPGAGKTTVTLALNICLDKVVRKMLVICPKSAFEAWHDIVDDCIYHPKTSDRFLLLEGTKEEIAEKLSSDHERFYINSESAYGVADLLLSFMIKNDVHLVIDESHRIKAGKLSQRGNLALRLAPLARRRDILSGTPMPQGPMDIASQLDFLYPGGGQGLRIQRGELPQEVMSGRFVRTRKDELALPPRIFDIQDVDMKPGHLALYSAVIDEIVGQFAESRLNTAGIAQVARKNSVRMLQASVFPQLVKGLPAGQSKLRLQAADEGTTSKMDLAAQICRQNAEKGLKTIVWTIFSDTLLKMQSSLIDLNAQVYFGGASDFLNGPLYDRSEALRSFKESEASFVLVANPAAGSEGLSLHHVCHHAVYLDRTYNASHFLQSIDRIHRLGLKDDVTTTISLIRNRTPVGIPNVDMSVWRRVKNKIENLEALLSDPDLVQIAMSEEDVEEAVDPSMDREDVMDLVAELLSKK